MTAETGLIMSPIVDDQIAVDLSQARPPDIKGKQSPYPKYDGTDAPKVYGWSRCYALAREYPQETAETAETFAVFASVSADVRLTNVHSKKQAHFFKHWRWQPYGGTAIEVTEPIWKQH